MRPFQYLDKLCGDIENMVLVSYHLQLGTRKIIYTVLDTRKIIYAVLDDPYGSSSTAV